MTNTNDLTRLAEQHKGRADDCGQLARAILADRERQAGDAVAWVDERAISWLEAQRNKRSAHITTKLSGVKSFERPMALYAGSAPVRQEKVDALREALLTARDHIDMDALRISHCKDAAAIDAAIASLPAPQAVPDDARMWEDDLYAFAGWLTTRPGVMPVGSTSDAAAMAEAVNEYINSHADRFVRLAAAPSPDGKAEQAEAPSLHASIVALADELDGELNSGSKWTKAQHTCCSVSGALRPLAEQVKALESNCKHLVAALREEVESPTFMGEPVLKPEWRAMMIAAHEKLASHATQPTASNAGEREEEPASIKTLREALALQGVPIGNMVDRHTAIERTLKAQLAWQSACTTDAIKWLLNRAALAPAQPEQVAQDGVPVDILKYATSMQKQGYSGPLMWASKIIDWVVDQGAARARGEGGPKG